jgi:hypothetical protein
MELPAGQGSAGHCREHQQTSSFLHHPGTALGRSVGWSAAVLNIEFQSRQIGVDVGPQSGDQPRDRRKDAKTKGSKQGKQRNCGEDTDDVAGAHPGQRQVLGVLHRAVPPTTVMLCVALIHENGYEQGNPAQNVPNKPEAGKLSARAEVHDLVDEHRRSIQREDRRDERDHAADRDRPQ